MINGLFKYFRPDDYSVSRLAERRVLLTPPKYFNDPWDFRAERVPVTDHEVMESFNKFEKEREASEAAGIGLWLPATFVLREKNDRFEKFKTSVTRSDFQAAEGSYMQTELSDIFGVVSLTDDPLNRLMWAHYAEAHRGFVIEFAHGQELKRDPLEVVVSPFGLAFKVDYQATLPKLERKFENAAKVYCIKHSSWEDEHEWRVIRMLNEAAPEQINKKTFYLLGFRPEYLLRIIFGLRICPTAKQQLLKMLQKKEFAHVQTETIVIDRTSGGLIRAPFQEEATST